MAKSWAEKMDAKGDLPKVVPKDGKTMAVPSPRQVEALMRQVRKGRVTSIGRLREQLAAEAGAATACPMTTGIFAWMAAHAAEEAWEQGARNVTPWWRTLKTGGELNFKYPGGPDRQREMLEDEGHTVVLRGSRWFVEGAA